MKCLSCGTDMTSNIVVTAKDRMEFEYDICRACGGIWLDKGELDLISFGKTGVIENLPASLLESTDEEIRPCPRCVKAKLSKISFKGLENIILDRCPYCGGIWLDGGELELVNAQREKISSHAGEGFIQFVGNAYSPYWQQRIKRYSIEGSASASASANQEPIRDAIKMGETEYNCPVCKPETKMDLWKIFGVEFESCPNCKGVFLDNGELRSLKNRSNEESWLKVKWVEEDPDTFDKTVAIANPAGRFCPKCENSQLLTVNYGQSDVLIDWCPSCEGIWLDNQEFDEIIEYLKDKLISLSSKNAEIREKLKNEITNMGIIDPTWEETLNSKAALSALVSVGIFESPELYRFLLEVERIGRSEGMISSL